MAATVIVREAHPSSWYRVVHPTKKGHVGASTPFGCLDRAHSGGRPSHYEARENVEEAAELDALSRWPSGKTLDLARHSQIHRACRVYKRVSPYFAERKKNSFSIYIYSVLHMRCMESVAPNEI